MMPRLFLLRMSFCSASAAATTSAWRYVWSILCPRLGNLNALRRLPPSLARAAVAPKWQRTSAHRSGPSCRRRRGPCLRGGDGDPDVARSLLVAVTCVED
jgi:hypothetical protein